MRSKIIIALMALALVACGPSKEDFVRQEVKDMVLAMASANISGPEADEKYKDIDKMLLEADMSYGNASLTRSTLEYHVRLAYERDAIKSLRVLHDKKAEPEVAKTIADQFLEERKRSGKTFAEFNVSPTEITRIISRNALEFIKSTGGNPTSADYKAAGLPVPTITRTVIRRVPATSSRTQTARRAPGSRPGAKQVSRPRA